MQKFIDQAKHNEDFHCCLCDNFTDKFFDWKVTSQFYVAIHYLKALSVHRKKDIGETHVEIANSVSPFSKGKPKMPINKTAWIAYFNLHQYSKTARYSGIDMDHQTYELIKKRDHELAKEELETFKKYIQGQGVDIGVVLPSSANNV